MLAGATTGAAMKREERPQVRRPTVAILPFTNMSDDVEQEFFSDGITEDIITDLSKILGLFVWALATLSSPIRARRGPWQRYRQELGVGLPGRGSVRKSGTQVRVTGQLIDTGDRRPHLGRPLGPRSYRHLRHPGRDHADHRRPAQGEAVCRGRTSIERPRPTTSRRTPTISGTRGVLTAPSKSTLFKLARRMFAKAIELDPRYARAYAGMADCDSFLLLHYHVDVSIGRILANTDKALALDNRLAEAHASRGLALSIEKRFEESITEFEQATALDRNSFRAPLPLCACEFSHGDFERAATLFEHAAEINADDYQSLNMLIQTYRSLGRDEEKDSAARRGIQRAEREMILHREPSGRHIWVSLHSLR